MTRFYCLKCKKETETASEIQDMTTNERYRLHGDCTVCGMHKNTLLVVQSENLLAKRTRDENTEQKIVEIFQNLVLLGKFLFKKILEDKSYNLLVIISMFIVKVVKN
ncbi:hypothetical protein RhiirB3_457527 [Rhizophagus irregularis]|nr:hypothetical protein RhiirB3_457527 [Rhizophagus irregularis]